MINSQVLSIVIGLIFIYLIYSLLATMIMEILASMFSFRAKILHRGIYRMLQDDCQFSNRRQSIIFLFRSLRIEKKKSNNRFTIWIESFKSEVTPEEESLKDQKFISAFYDHPTIKYLSEGSYRNKPAYIRKETFSKVAIDLLRGSEINAGDDTKSEIADSLSKNEIKWGKTVKHNNNSGLVNNSNTTFLYLKSIWVDAQGDMDKFKTYLEEWFEETMERTSGWYKKNSQFILFFLGLFIAVAFNVNTIKIVKKLEKDPKLREQLISQADNFLKATPKGPAIIKSEHSDSLFEWTHDLLNNDVHNLNNVLSIEREIEPLEASITGWNRTQKRGIQILKHIYSNFMGWLLTALAISLGAPFWFDLLNKVMRLRTSIAKKSEDQTGPINRSDASRQVSNKKRKG